MYDEPQQSSPSSPITQCPYGTCDERKTDGHGVRFVKYNADLPMVVGLLYRQLVRGIQVFSRLPRRKEAMLCVGRCGPKRC